MGISGLLPLLAPIQRQVHLRDFKGLTVAVDTYVWLHRAAFGCAMDLGLNKPTTAYISFCMKRIALLKEHGITPLLVFDGGCLPMKHHTESERRKRRKEARKRAHEELAKGNNAKAMEMFQQCVDITPNMAWELMKVLRNQGIEFIVAPYEADAQLVYLEKIKKVDAVLTEDSDLLVFGCQRLLLKLEASGNLIEIRAKDFPQVPCMKKGWSFAKFRQACILSGCDYLPSLKGVGIKKAFDALNGTSDAERLLKMWKTFGHSMKAPPVRDNYQAEFQEAELTFLYQRVYDPVQKALVYLNTPEGGVELIDDMSRFLGQNMESSVAEGVATGHLNPYTLKPYSLDDGFVYDDESDIPKPIQIKNRPPEKSLQEHKLPQDLSNSSKLLVSSANLARATKVVETSRKSHFFPTSSQSTPELSQPKLSSSPPDLLENVCSTATPEWFSGASSQPSVQFTDSQLSKFMYSSQSITDGFSYHQSSIRLATTISHQTFSKPAESNKYEEEKNSENLDGIQLFGSMAEYSDTEVVTGVLSQDFQSATCDKEFDASNASVVNDQSQNENAGPSLSQPSQNEENPKVQYMEWNHSTPPAHSSQTQRHVNKAVESAVNRLGLFRVNSNEKNLYSSVLKKPALATPRPLARSASSSSSTGTKKRLGTGRPSTTTSITQFFGRK